MYKYIYIYNKDINKNKEEKGKYNNNGFLKIFRIKKSIKYILIINIIKQISSKINYHENILLNSSEIILKINNTGMNNILSNYYIGAYHSCPSLIYLNNNTIQNLGDCTQINIDTPGSIVKLVWNNPLNSSQCLFCFCSNITEIKFLNFDTSSLTDMQETFGNCTSLTSVDVSNLNIKNVKIMHGMFRNCPSLKFINLSNFDTSSVENMTEIFYGCNSLTSIDLSNFDTSNVKYMSRLFYNCQNLEYINLLNFTDINETSIEYSLYMMFYGIKTNAVICIDKNKAPSIYNLANSMECVAISCRTDWWNVQYKIDEEEKCIIDWNLTNNRYEYNGKCYDTCPNNTTLYNNKCYSNEELCDSNCKTCYFAENIPISSNCSSCYENKYLKNGKCVDDCKNDSDYQYEFNHTCYHECPYNISVKSKTKEFYCEVKCSKENPFEIIETQTCVSSCSITQRESGMCKINYISEDENINKEVEEKAIENVKEELTNGFNTSNIDSGKNVVIGQKHSTIAITSTENQKKEKTSNSNSTTIDLWDCEAKIKDEYGIPKNKSLYILKIDVKQEGFEIPKIAYEVYYPLFGDNLI